MRLYEVYFCTTVSHPADVISLLRVFGLFRIVLHSFGLFHFVLVLRFVLSATTMACALYVYMIQLFLV